MTRDDSSISGDNCRLCRKSTILLRSHILPEFFYSSVYDNLHRTMLIASDEKERFIQKGIREKLLCQECETKFSRYEGYAVKIIQDIPNFEKDPAGTFVHRQGIDYKLFKLFQLSILWRSGVSKEKMFAGVNLVKHEEIVRLMLHNEDPGSTKDYGCLIIQIPESKKIHRIIMPPMRDRLFGHNGIQFMIGNLFWHFVTSSHAVPKDVEAMFLQETGILRIWTAPWSENQVYANIAKLFSTRRIKD